MRNILLILVVILSFDLQVNGQNSPDLVVIEGKTIRTVEPAERMTESPKIIDTIIPTPTMEYALLHVQEETSIDLETINAANVKMVDKLNPLYKSYIKAGIGSELMPLGEFYFSNTRSRKYTYGAHLKHLSSLADIKGHAPSTYDRSTGNIYGAILEKRYSLSGELNYGNKGFHYYGIPNDSLNRDSLAQRFNSIGGAFQFNSHEKDSAHINYSVGLKYNNFFSNKHYGDSLEAWRAKENYFAFLSSASYRLGNELFAADFGIRYNGYKYGVQDSAIAFLDSGIVSNNTIINLKPTITTLLKNNRFKAKIGVDLTLDAHDNNKFYVYPIAEVKYSMFNDIFIPFAGINGGLNQNTFRSITTQNEFVLSNINLKNEHNAINFYFGLKGTLSKRMSFNVNAKFSNFKNRALFIPDTTYSLSQNYLPGGRFNVIYDTVNLTTFEGALSYQLNEKLKIDAAGKYYSASLNNNTYAWNYPIFEVLLRGKYNLYDHFIINFESKLEGGRKTLVYQKMEGSTEEDGQHAISLGTIVDINLGLEYRYNSRISAFIQGNNMVGNRYKRWYNTPVQGIQVMGGVTFKF